RYFPDDCLGHDHFSRPVPDHHFQALRRYCCPYGRRPGRKYAVHRLLSCNGCLHQQPLWLLVSNRHAAACTYRCDRIYSHRHSATPGGPDMRHSPTAQWFRSASHLFLAWLITLCFALPIYLALSGAFKIQEQILSNPLGLPAPFTFDNIINALTRPDNLVVGGLMTSTMITAISVIILIPFSSAVSFWVSEQGPRLKTILL